MKKTYLFLFIFVMSLLPQNSDASGYLDNHVLNYMASVSGGIDIVQDYTKQKTGASVSSIESFWNSFEKITLENFEKISGGFNYLIEDILTVSVEGVSKIKHETRNYSVKFASNIVGNLQIFQRGIENMTASVSGGVKNNIDLILITDESGYFKPASTSNIPVLKESLENVFNYTAFWIKTN